MFAFRVSRRLQIVSRVVLFIAIVFNAVAPTTAIAMSPPDTSAATAADNNAPDNDAGEAFSRPGQEQGVRVSLARRPKTATPTATDTPTETPTPVPIDTATATPIPTDTATLDSTATSTDTAGTPTATATGTQPPVAAGQTSGLSFKFTAAPAEAAPGDVVTFTIDIANNGQTPASGLVFSNTIPADFGDAQNAGKDFDFNPKTRLLTWSSAKAGAPPLAPGQTLSLAYTVRMNGQQDEVELVDTATLNADGLAAPLSADANLTLLSPGKDVSPIGRNGGQALGLRGHVRVDLPQNAVSTSSELVIQDLSGSAPSAPTADQPSLKFAIELRVPAPARAQSLPTRTDAGPPQEQDRIVPLEPAEAKFDQPVQLTVSFAGIADLSTVGADQVPFLVTLDEASGTWVRMPIKSIDRQANQITADVTHFSVWGAGLGAAFPTGGSLLLFDTATPDLFTGHGRYSLPIWTPPGRNGMAPKLSLSYSSGLADGILGDVQASWVGMGWNIDSVEIARKITTTSCGTGCVSYGYQNKFSLLFNGTAYELVTDNFTAGRYHTKSESFLYIQLHNNALNNNSPAAANATSEWWEVVQKDGTRWQLGTKVASEQLAAMKGYPGAAGGAWAALGYAGSATDVVASRWRADKATDVYGNQMTFTYTEENRLVAGTSTNYDRASYLANISYTGHTSGSPLPGYSVVFVPQSRGTDEVPTVVSEFDNWDTFRLDRIDVMYGPTVVRTYDLGYTVGSYSDGVPVASWQTTMLTSVAISGGGTVAPTLGFSYDPFDNRAVQSTSSNEWRYPRMTGMTNGWGGSSTFHYVNDARPATSWYNYRVDSLSVSDGVTGSSPMKTLYAQSGPCYNDTTAGWCNASNVGELIGYGQTTVTVKDFGGVTTLGVTVHRFHTDEQKAGREYQVQRLDTGGTTVLSQTDTTYNINGVVDAFDSRFVSINTVNEYQRGSSGLIQMSHTQYWYDWGNTGNLIGLDQYEGGGLGFKSTSYGYITNTNPSVWILDTLAFKEVDAGGAVSREEYGYNGNLPGVGSPTKTKPDLVRRVDGTTTIDAKYVYDTYGNVTTTRLYKGTGTTDAQPSTTYRTYTTAYDTALKTYVVSSDPPIIPATTTGYDFGLGLPTTVTDANGNTTTTDYDGLGRVIAVRYPGSTHDDITYTYPTPPVGAPFALQMNLWDETVSGYTSAWQIMDGLGRVIQVQRPYETAGNIIVEDTSYNALGLVFNNGLPRTVSATGGIYQAPNWGNVLHKTTSYDTQARLASVGYPDGSVESYSYAVGPVGAHVNPLRTTIIDRNNHKTVEEHNAFGTLLKVEEYTGNSTSTYSLYATTTYDFDSPFDLLTRVTDAAGNLTTITYDGFGRKTSMTDPDLGTWNFTYDVFDNLKTRTDARNCGTTFTYDDLSRLKTKTYSGPGACNTTPDVTYTYDVTTNGNEGKGRRTGMSSTAGSTTWSYNVLGQVAQEVHTLDGTNFTITNNFDVFGRPMTQDVPSQGGSEHLIYGYNAMGALSSLGNGSSSYVHDIHHNASGQVTDQSLGNGLLQQFCYDPSTLRPTGLRVYPGTVQGCGAAPASPVLNLSYGYQPNGNVSQIVDATRSETLTFTYDELDRLDTVSGPFSHNYDYNTLGNITTKNTTTYTYGNAAHKHAVTGLSTGESYTYDANGNMITRVEGGLTYTQTFDAENRLVSVTVSGNTTSFAYDGDGNLVRKTNPDGKYTLYVGMIYESNRNADGTTSSTKTFYPAGGAMRVDGTRYYILKDNLGSATVVTNQSATAIGQDRFYPFGETRVSSGNMQTDKLFTGQREITGLGIYSYGARFYSPKLGRFLSADLLVPGYSNPQNLNRFSYVRNNPIKYIDPSGLCTLSGHWMPDDSSACQWYNNYGGGSNNNNNNNNNNGSNYCDTHPGSCGNPPPKPGGGGGGGNSNDNYCDTHPGSCGNPLPNPNPNPDPGGPGDNYCNTHPGACGDPLPTVTPSVDPSQPATATGTPPGSFTQGPATQTSQTNSQDWTKTAATIAMVALGVVLIALGVAMLVSGGFIVAAAVGELAAVAAGEAIGAAATIEAIQGLFMGAVWFGGWGVAGIATGTKAIEMAGTP